MYIIFFMSIIFLMSTIIGICEKAARGESDVLAIKPQKGAAVLFYTLVPDGTLDKHSVHENIFFFIFIFINSLMPNGTLHKVPVQKKKITPKAFLLCDNNVA
jgi:hypothetical protein